jgi:predicted PurR-regulated permease PerM
MGSGWKLVLVFAVLFLVGALSGSVITSSLSSKQQAANPTRNLRAWSDHLMRKIEQVAKLTPEQSAKIRPQVEAAVRQMQTIQIQAMIQGSDAFDAAISEIEAGLNPDQQRRLERFRERRRAYLQESIATRQQQQR